MSNLEYQCDRCGEIHPISPAQAGTALDCSCGFKIALPPLSQLRKQAGMAAYEKSTAETITEMVGDGRLPETPICVNCGVECDEMPLVAICERPRLRTHSTGGSAGGFVAGLIAGIPFFVPIGGGSQGDLREEQLGRDVVVPVPVRICDHCWNAVTGHRVNDVFRKVTLAVGFASAVLLLLWFAEPILGFGVPFTWAISCFGVAVVFWIGKRWCSSRSTRAVKSLLRKTPIYRVLCEEYPDAEVFVGELGEHPR